MITPKDVLNLRKVHLEALIKEIDTFLLDKFSKGTSSADFDLKDRNLYSQEIQYLVDEYKAKGWSVHHHQNEDYNAKPWNNLHFIFPSK
jgi:hypothetical protein